MHPNLHPAHWTVVCICERFSGNCSATRLARTKDHTHKCPGFKLAQTYLFLKDIKNQRSVKINIKIQNMTKKCKFKTITDICCIKEIKRKFKKKNHQMLRKCPHLEPSPEHAYKASASMTEDSNSEFGQWVGTCSSVRAQLGQGHGWVKNTRGSARSQSSSSGESVHEAPVTNPTALQGTASTTALKLKLSRAVR